jgi:hypothetical protein
VDGVAFTSAITFSWAFGSLHTIATTLVQQGPAGTQYLWSAWNDGGGIVHTVRPTAATTFNAVFSTQYMLTMTTGPGGSVSPAGGFQDAASVVSIRATANAGRIFSGWIGSGTGSFSGRNNPVNVTMNGPISESAAFDAGVAATVGTSPPGRTFTVDGSTFTSARTFTWPSGSFHSISTTSPQAGSEGTRYVLSSWSDGGSISHTVQAKTDTTFTASFTTQYLLTTGAGPGGFVSPGSSFQDAGVVIPIGATPSAGRVFTGWFGRGPGSYSGTNNPASVTMSGPISETAFFDASLPPGLNLSWGDAPSRWDSVRLFACNSNAGADTLTLSFVSADSLNAFSGIEFSIVAQADADSLPAWWRLAPDAPDGCRRALTATIDFSGGSPTRRDPWSSASTGGATVQLHPDSVPSRVRVVGAAARPPTQLGQISPGVEYYAMKLILDHQNTMGASACAGCSVPVCLRLDYLVLTQGNGLPSSTLKAASATRVAGWQGAACGDTTFSPKVFSISPAVALAGTNVRIDGRLFSTSDPLDLAPGLSVSFNGTNAPRYTINSAKTQINVTVPAGLTPGPVTVANRYGSAASATIFTTDFGRSTLVVKTNPALGEAVLEFVVPEPGHTNVAVFAASGALVRTLYSGQAPAGPTEVRWDGLSSAGTRMAPGLYFLRMDHMGTRQTRRLVLLR